jgi:hypothetical protein
MVALTRDAHPACAQLQAQPEWGTRIRFCSCAKRGCLDGKSSVVVFEA